MLYPHMTAQSPRASAFRLLAEVDLDQPPSDIFAAVLPKLGQQLQCDRVFLYLRSPQRHIGRVPFCWRRHDDIPLVYDEDWKLEPRWLARQDPLFAAALKGRPSLFIEDVEMADPKLVNRNFERQTFGHRALIHAHLLKGRNLWGILQPCVFEYPRQWNRSDRLLLKQAVSWLTPLAVEYVNHHQP
jgi:GAF domain-containing protein